VDLPERLSGRTSSAACTSGTLSIIVLADCCPCTQIKLRAGTHNVHTRYPLEAANDLNYNIFS
jgi:hypothetical protein